jgi:hypothetical protein
MRDGLHSDRLRRLARLARGAIVASAVVALRKPAFRALATVLKKLGLAPAADGVQGARQAQEARVSTSVGGPSGRGAEAGVDVADVPREAHVGDSPERRAAVARAADLAAEAAAQLQHLGIAVPPPERDAALERTRAELAEAAEASAPLTGEASEIPWGYGKDRVTAAVVDPDRLYVYWEVTDEAIGRARAELGPAGEGAWLNLRVYDTTGILFDGTNAHHWFDHGLGRSERQWFFDVRRPTSSAFVEVGLRAHDGSFARIARSARVEFPRAERTAWTEPEWMTVVASTGDLVPAGRGAPAVRSPVPAPGPYPQEHSDGVFTTVPQPFTPIPLWVIRTGSAHEAWVRELTESGWERVEWREVEGEHWVELLGRVEWQGPRTTTTWEAGPFSYPVEVRPPTREEWQGHSVAYQVGGVTRMVHGPWQVVIRNLGAHVSRQVLGKWEIYRSWVAEGGREVREGGGAAAARQRPPGASEGLARGASERAWLRGSEERLGGASELWRMGASELRLRGASEQLLAGGSERVARGASERMQRGGSEWLLRGASERILAGASERVRQGGSERMRMGASERIGASERVLGGASERARQGGSEGRLGASERRLAPEDARPAAPPPAGHYPKSE